jgi:uncharacterized protein
MRYSTLIVSALFSTLTLLFSGCVAHPEPAAPVAIDKTLPQVHINGHLSDTDAIAFEWKPVTDPRVKGIRIYRDNPGEKDKKTYRIATVDNTLTTHYVDNGLKPGTVYRYRFTTYDAKGRESQPNATVTAKTLSLPEPVTFFTATKELARSAKLLWRPHPDLRVTGYEIERLDPGEKAFHRVDVVNGRLNAEYIDHDLDDNQVYRYRIRAVSFNGRKSAPSAVVTVSTKPLPLPPKALQASRGEIRAVTLRWKAPPNKDIAFYNVYRADSEDGYYAYRAKVPKPVFIDKTGENGADYYYKVTAVDKDGLESLPSEPVNGTTMAAPAAPKLTGLAVKGNAIVVRWQSAGAKTVSYELIKKTYLGWFDTKERTIRGLKTTSFTDVNVTPGTEYGYAVVAVDADGLKSDPSDTKTILVEAP